MSTTPPPPAESGSAGGPDDPGAAPWSPEVAAAELRRWAPEVAELVAEYLEGLGGRPVGPAVEPGWLLERLPAHPPQSAQGMAPVLEDVVDLVLPATVAWQSPGFHGYFPANTSWPAALADLLSTGLAQQGMLWATSPAATELEMRMLDWVAELCGLPERFRHSSAGPGGGVIQDSASSGTLVALVAARERAGGRDSLAEQVVYASEHAHSSVVKGARIAGFRDDLIRGVPVDAELALDPVALAAAMEEDTAAGLRPSAVVATVGTTSTMAVDPVEALTGVARRHGAWVHVDAAMAGGATICPEHRQLNDGLDGVDSYLFNPHKWWGVTFDCTAMYLADRAPVLDALSITMPYLRNAASASGDVVDFRDWQVPLGRRFRALKLWFVLRGLGADAIREMVRGHVLSAQRLVGLVVADPRWELAAPPRLNLVCVRSTEGEEATLAAIERVNSSGRALVTPTVVDGRTVVRLSVGAPATQSHHVDALWELLAGPVDGSSQ